MIVGVHSRSRSICVCTLWPEFRGWGGDPLWLQLWSHLCLTWAVCLYWYYVKPMLSLEFNILSRNPMLSLKFSILSHNFIPSGENWKIPSETGFFFPDDHFEYHQTMLSWKSKVFITICVWNWGPFQGVNSRSGSSSRSILGLYILTWI